MKLHKKSILKKTLFVSFSLLLSKFLGIAREILQVKYMGVGPLSDAFNSAFKIPQLLRKIFAEGALSAAFIPTIVGIMRTDNENQVNRLMTLMCIAFGSLVLGLCIIASFFPKALILLAAPGFATKPLEFCYAVQLIRILVYFVFFIFWSALLSGALQAKMHFAVPSWGPALMNVFYIGGLLISLYCGLPVNAFAFFLLAGGAVQALLALFVYFKLGFSLWWPNKQTFKYFNEVLIKFIPCILSVSVIEINLLIDNRFASTLPAGAPTLIGLASRFMTIALGAFAVAFSSILLPHFSRIVTYAPRRLSFYLLESTKLIFWITVPVACLMSFFSYDIFYTIFYKLAKNFTLEQVDEASKLLIAFLPGLFFFSFNKMVLSIYYALHETRYTTAISLVGTLCNIVLNRLLMPPLGSLGIAIATSCAALIQSILFVIVLHKKFEFHLYYRRLLSFIMSYVLQLSLFLLIFYGLYKVVRAGVTLLMPHYADVLLNTFWLWFLVGPLSLIFAGLLYVCRNKWNLRLYFLE